MFVKYDHGRGPGDHFTFSSEGEEGIRSAAAPVVLALLICDTEAVAGIARDELSRLLPLTNGAASTVKVSSPQGRQVRISGPGGELPLVAPAPGEYSPGRSGLDDA
ncbi:hypothetical protein [Streptomyces sp. enrichment culture]|uniref:hypothetical protein n=1 Tax=Streptomyces sp. enrichment culture TaxID=1795815 RepID=UPI003F56317B